MSSKKKIFPKASKEEQVAKVKKAIMQISKTQNKDALNVTKKDLLSFGISDWTFKTVSLEEIRKSLPKVEKKPHVLSDFTKESLGSIVKENDFKEGVFFVTAASPTSYLDWSVSDHETAKAGGEVQAHNVFTEGFAAVQTFLKSQKAELVILPMPAHVKALQKQPLHYDPFLQPYKKNFATEFTFNTHLKAIEAFLNPQQGNPLTGFKRLRVHKYTKDNTKGAEIKRQKTSLIVAHSKQMLEVVPTGNSSHPRLIHSTGTITKPSYLKNRVGMMANEDHKLGGLIIEIKGKMFWVRQVQFDTKNGSFIDNGIRYHANGKVTEERAEAFKLGDLHIGHDSEIALNAVYDLWDKVKPKNIFLEDAFDSSSISHHLVNKRITRAKIKGCFSNLYSEIEQAKKILKQISDRAPKDANLIMTASNHPDHVMKYLEEGRYLNDSRENYDIGHRMVVMALDGKNPLQEFLDPNKKMNWTDENEDIYIEGVQMNVHGHLGPNGSRGNKLGHELAHGKVMAAHSHTPSIYHDCFTVGHTSTDRHGYNQGASSWVLCSGTVYKGGHMQLHMIIDGSAFMPKKKNVK